MNRRGFTLIEMLIVITIMGILVVSVLTIFTKINSSQAIDKDAQLLVETLRQAQSQTLSSQNASQYGVHIATTSVTLFTGTTYSSSDTSNKSFLFNTRDIVSTISLIGGSTNVVFKRLTGETDQSGTITLFSPAASSTKTVTIYKTGVIQSN
jgi:prepilin-type N-terminal cleavage/methylation domain-containing protein